MFKDSFKYYKRKQPAPDFSDIINVNSKSEETEAIHVNRDVHQKNIFGLIPAEKWEIYRIKTKPGLIFIRNPFTSSGQRFWITRCLRDFSSKPQKLNIDTHNYLKQEENWWDVCISDPVRRAFLQDKLRWATLGYHHDWDLKVYSDASKDTFPIDLADLCKYVANVIGFKGFRAEAAIVNYYHMNSTLSGHTDHSEIDLEAPLLSFSFGQSAIFLIGGVQEVSPALPLRIDSGDIVIMSKESRLCYHAVPRILPSTSQPWNDQQPDDNLQPNSWQPFSDYVATRRINMNVRQVLTSGLESLNGSE